MRKTPGDITKGDVGIQIIVVTNEVLSGNIDMEFKKPSGATITRDVHSIDGATAIYYTQPGDIDEDGIWDVYLKDSTTGFYYNEYGGNSFRVRPTPAEMGATR